MKTRVPLAVCAVTVGLALDAHAATMSSPAIFGSHGQNKVTCVVLNTSSQTVQITLKILTEAGTAVVTGTQNVPPNSFIVANANITFGAAYACTATASSLTGLSGALTIRDTVPDGFGGSHDRPIRSAPLR